MTDSSNGFESVMADLERIVERLGGEELELDEALALFEQGVERLREASRLLDSARGRVEQLIEESSGELSLLGFEVDAETDDD
jgi:exodeoxyribonuclease VII small subunit